MPNFHLRDFMTKTPAFVLADSPLSEVITLFECNSFRHLPVLMSDEVVGILSQRDVFLAGSLAGSSDLLVELTAADICTPDPFIAEIDTDLAEVIRVMGERKLGAAIVTRGGALAGIFTTTDVCRLCAMLLEQERRNLQ